MNVLIRADDGSLIALTPREAEQRIAQLRRQRTRADSSTAARIDREIDELGRVADPSRAYEVDA